jgi:hypothetical protein
MSPEMREARVGARTSPTTDAMKVRRDRRDRR